MVSKDILESAAALTDHPGYQAVLRDVDSAVDGLQQRLLTVEDPQEFLRLGRYWQFVKRMMLVLHSEPLRFSKALQEEIVKPTFDPAPAPAPSGWQEEIKRRLEEAKGRK